VWITSDHGNKGINHQAHHEEDLEHGHVELGGSEPANCKTVEHAAACQLVYFLSKSDIVLICSVWSKSGIDIRVNDQADDNNGFGGNLVGPVTQEDIDGCDLIGDVEC
jgi:hypothetical protein